MTTPCPDLAVFEQIGTPTLRNRFIAHFVVGGDLLPVMFTAASHAGVVAFARQWWDGEQRRIARKSSRIAAARAARAALVKQAQASP